MTDPTKIPHSGWDAFQQIARSSFRALQTNVPSALQQDAQAVHAMRIEIARIKAAARFFGTSIDGNEWKVLRKQFDWLNKTLGKARNCDVGLHYSNKKRYRKASARARLALQHKREKVYRKLGRDLQSNQFAELNVRFGRWIRREPQKAKASFSLSKYCRRRLGAWRKNLRHASLRLNSFRRRQLHQLRIRSKEYRYIVESLHAIGAPLSQEDIGFAKTMRRVQRELGELRDLRRLRKFIGRRLPAYRSQKRARIRNAKRLYSKK
ncbi:MAG: CHAD domain-containing protein [Afipia sp.]|nr:CHAD domain-containing protein [Afipia sp.]